MTPDPTDRACQQRLEWYRKTKIRRDNILNRTRTMILMIGTELLIINESGIEHQDRMQLD